MCHYSVLKMKRTPPEPRYDTAEARQSIAKKLNLPYRDTMQNWPWEVAQPGDIEVYIHQYDSTTDEDELFVLMEMILQATTEQISPEKFEKSWTEVELRLKKNFLVHQSSVYYWCCWDLEDIQDCFQITPSIRELWNKEKTKTRYNT